MAALSNNSVKSDAFAATASAIACTSAELAAFSVAAFKLTTAASIFAKPSAKAASTSVPILLCSEVT